ncbi:MAG: GTPase, partial [Dolichospermum sp.]
MLTQVIYNDAVAIAHCLNQSLTFDGIIAKVSVKNDCLKIALESVAVTKKDQLLPVIMREIANFKLTSIKTVKIYGKQIKTFDPNWYHNFDLYPQNNYDYSQSNKSKNNRNTSNDQVEIPKGKVSQTEFKEALKKCSETAKSAYKLSIRYAEEIEKVITKLNSEIIVIINDVNDEILNKKGADKFQLATTLKQIQLDIKTLSENSVKDLVISLDKKRKHLKDFTVALFGRTKAGKSTLRETLTRGNGSTIGKGSQRTTRDVKEYSWEGLRLLDTPGIEAYQGDDDTNKANDIIDQSDIVLFLTSDDSVQPGEFQAMAQLQKINKYFAVILNVKHDISNNLEDLQMFIDIPEMVFDEDRLSQHKNHIQSHIKEYLNLHNVDIVPIHAQSGFLSTKSEYQEYSSQLWELSKIEELYSLIAYQIYNNGQKLRLSTFADSLDSFIVLINQNLNTAKDELSKQLKFMHQKKQELEKIFTEVKKDGNFQIKSECESLYNRIENQIGNFVDKYSDDEVKKLVDNFQDFWEKYQQQKKLSIAFIGQYNAGKSTLIKALTGDKSVRISAEICTDKVTEYAWQDVLLLDTPGIYAGNKQHDGITLERISKCDLLVFVVPNELFNPQGAEFFQKVANQMQRVGQMVLVVNKMSRESGSPQVLLSTIAKVIEPYYPQQFYTCFIDADSYLKSQDPKYIKYQQSLQTKSNFNDFLDSLEKLIQKNELSAKLVTPLHNAVDTLEKSLNCLSTNDEKTRNSLEILRRAKIIVQASQTRARNAYRSELAKLKHEVIMLSEKIASMIDGHHAKEEIEVEIEKVTQEITTLSEKTIGKIQAALEEELKTLKEK